MNRHILGLSVFLVIVKTTFLLYWGFFAPKPFVNFADNEVYTQNEVSNKTSCFPKLEKPLSAAVDIATLDLETGKFSLSLNSNSKSNLYLNEHQQIFLTFYTKDSQPRKIATEFVASENYDANQIEITRFVNWSRLLKPNQNLYVVPYKYAGREISSGFDETNAIPVLLIGKR